MTTFKLNYKNGTHEVVQTDAQTVEDQLNRTFGLSPEQAEEFGVSVELLPDDPEDLLQALTKEVVTHPDETVLVPTADGSGSTELNQGEGGATVMSGTFGVSESSEAGDSSN